METSCIARGRMVGCFSVAGPRASYAARIALVER